MKCQFTITAKPNYLVDIQAINRDVLLSTLTLLETYHINTLLSDHLDPTELSSSVKHLLRELAKEGIAIVATSTYKDVLKSLVTLSSYA